MGLDERQQPFVFLSFPEKLERNATRADGTDHRRHFDRRFIFSDSNFQVEDVINMHVCLAFDDASAQRQIHHGAFPSHFPA